MIPIENRLDIYIKNEKLAALISTELTRLEAEKACQHICSGWAMGYRNYMYAAHPQLIADLKGKCFAIDGMYVNEDPPEIAQAKRLEEADYFAAQCSEVV